MGLGIQACLYQGSRIKLYWCQKHFRGLPLLPACLLSSRHLVKWRPGTRNSKQPINPEAPNPTPLFAANPFSPKPEWLRYPSGFAKLCALSEQVTPGNRICKAARTKKAHQEPKATATQDPAKPHPVGLYPKGLPNGCSE